ncbi:hypothetical protein LG201_00765 [Methylobacillus gramineus]|uniref:COG4648 family protein n=1 Tax=Methylobacillus gramineus TaxID=755169 RepID=UPI001CFFFA92|nr:hypothetical protein [Methylobacillus gramineus]MCB5183735.1 hypothetical protein [Methylobacillus gramineus]
MDVKAPLGRLYILLLWLVYPVIIFFGLQWLAPRYLAALLGLTLLLRWRKLLPSMLQRFSYLQKGIAATLLIWVLATALFNNELLLRTYPAILSLGMLLIFGLSLKYPPSTIEIFARMQTSALPPAAIAYTRKVTMVWCLFFLINGTIALYTALYASRANWALYNGFIAYLIMGVLFIGEWLIRQRAMTREA